MVTRDWIRNRRGRGFRRAENRQPPACDNIVVTRVTSPRLRVKPLQEPIMTLPENDPLDCCFRRARMAADDKPLPEAAPLGFATRVLARLRENEAAGAESRDWTLWLMPRAIGVAALCAVGMLLLGFGSDSVRPDHADESELGSLVMNLALEEKP